MSINQLLILKLEILFFCERHKPWRVVTINISTYINAGVVTYFGKYSNLLAQPAFKVNFQLAIKKRGRGLKPPWYIPVHIHVSKYLQTICFLYKLIKILGSTSKQYLKISDDYTRFILISFKTFWQLIVYFNYFEDVSTSHA